MARFVMAANVTAALDDEAGNKFHKFKWRLQGNQLTLHTIFFGTDESPGDMVPDRTNTSVGGGKFTVSARSAKPGYKFKNAVAREGCEILPGNAPR